ncbi:MAG: alpha/beta hydrolase [Chitinophagaceae bacterium]
MKWLIGVPVILAIIYFLGPQPVTPKLNNTLPVYRVEGHALELAVDTKEGHHKSKPDNEARILWYNDSLKTKTEYAIVYLHGFSASQAEGEPVHRNIAKIFGCNLYLSRLAEHGIDTSDALAKLTADNYWESAKEALAIGKQLGKKVILMGTSTGGTLAILLAAKFPEVHSLILMSPNISINDPNAWLLNDPWGIQVARTVLHSKYVQSKDQHPLYRQYWNYKYRVEAAVQLEELLETSMVPRIFDQVSQPVLIMYYYKDPVHQDSVVKVSAMLTMFQQLGTADRLKKSVAMPNTGNHVIGSYIKSNDFAGVQLEIKKFMTEVLHIKPA